MGQTSGTTLGLHVPGYENILTHFSILSVRAEVGRVKSEEPCQNLLCRFASALVQVPSSICSAPRRGCYVVHLKQ